MMQGIRSSKQWKDMRNFFARDVAQTSLALSQMVKERNLRMMGAWGKDDTERMVHTILLAHQIVNMCEMFLWSYYMPLFAQYWSLRRRFTKFKMLRKVNELTSNLQWFRGPYSLFMVAHEAGMTIFDMKFDHYHTVATALGMDEQDEDQQPQRGPTWVAADATRLEALKRAQYAVQDRIGSAMQGNEKSRFPSFEEALELARTNTEKYLTGALVPSVESVTPAVASVKNTRRRRREEAPVDEEDTIEDEDVSFYSGTEDEDG